MVTVSCFERLLVPRPSQDPKLNTRTAGGWVNRRLRPFMMRKEQLKMGGFIHSFVGGAAPVAGA